MPFKTHQHALAVLLLAGTLHAQAPTEAPAHHRTSANRTYIGQDITVSPGQQIHDAACLFCSVEVEGDLSGNVVVLFGNLTVTGHIAGNTAVIGGNTIVDTQARIGGRTTVIGGNAVYDADESLSGNAYVLGGHISSFARQGSPHRRLSLSPAAFAAIALILLLLLGATLFPQPRTR